MVSIGKVAVDTITGFRGRVTGRCEYIDGQVDVLLAPKTKIDRDYIEPRWFSEKRVEEVEAFTED